MTNTEWTTTTGLEQNAAMVAAKYTKMVFDSGDVTPSSTEPVNEVKRVTATATRTGQNIVWYAAITAGDFTSDTIIKAIWMASETDGVSTYLACHKIAPQIVNASQGLGYEFPYTISGYLEDYDN